MDLDEIIPALVILVVFGVPALALSVRIAVKPVAEALARLRESMGGDADVSRQVLARLEAVEQEVAGLRSTVQRLEEAADFHAELESGEGGG